MLQFCPQRTHSFTRRLPGVYRLWSSRTENNIQYVSRPGSCYRCHPPNTFRSGRAQPPKRERVGFPDNFETQGLGAHVARRARTAAPRPRSTPLMRPRSFVSPRHKSCGDPRLRTGFQSGQAIVREGAERPVMKVYIYIGMYRYVGHVVPAIQKSNSDQVLSRRRPRSR